MLMGLKKRNTVEGVVMPPGGIFRPIKLHVSNNLNTQYDRPLPNEFITTFLVKVSHLIREISTFKNNFFYRIYGTSYMNNRTSSIIFENPIGNFNFLYKNYLSESNLRQFIQFL